MSYESETDSYPPTTQEYNEIHNKYHDTNVKLIEARKIISDFVCSEISYMTVNNLGDPFRQQNVRRAVQFLLQD